MSWTGEDQLRGSRDVCGGHSECSIDGVETTGDAERAGAADARCGRQRTSCPELQRGRNDIAARISACPGSQRQNSAICRFQLHERLS